ncbi:MAG: hypothetical protein ABR499_00040 [Gemmatimonadaceae bacterium]
MSDSVEVALQTLGVRCTLEPRGALAVLVPAPGERAFERPDIRREALAILRAYGFTHAALEAVGDDDRGATVGGPSA